MPSIHSPPTLSEQRNQQQKIFKAPHSCDLHSILEIIRIASHWDCKELQPISVPMDLLGLLLWCVWKAETLGYNLHLFCKGFFIIALDFNDALLPTKTNEFQGLQLFYHGILYHLQQGIAPKLPFSKLLGEDHMFRASTGLKYF